MNNHTSTPSQYVQPAPATMVAMITYPIFTFYLLIATTVVWIVIRKIYYNYREQELILLKKRRELNQHVELNESSASILSMMSASDQESLATTPDDALFEVDSPTSKYTAPKKNENYLLRPREIGIELGFKNLGVRLTSGKSLLEGVTGRISPGKLTAVMGPSGAGKSTFLSCLSGRINKGHLEGSIYLNNKKDDIGKYKRIVGFVPQDDIMFHELTVKETLRFSAETRLPSHVTPVQKAIIVEEVMDILGLSDIRFLNVEQISGGQRKRVNIGMELVADPVIIFLDEPTSGLDSSSSKEVCSVLRRLSALGLTLVAVIHQPRYEIFDMFDDVLLLGKVSKLPAKTTYNPNQY